MSQSPTPIRRGADAQTLLEQLLEGMGADSLPR